MPIIDEDGTQHIVAIDEITRWGIAHLEDCEQCQAKFPISYLNLVSNRKRRIVSDEFVKSKTQDDSVEWYLRQLSETDKQISDLIHKRSSLRETIQARMGKLNEAIYSSDDWFNGDVRGNPVEDRCVEAPAETRSEYNQRRF